MLPVTGKLPPGKLPSKVCPPWLELGVGLGLGSGAIFQGAIFQGAIFLVLKKYAVQTYLFDRALG